MSIIYVDIETAPQPEEIIKRFLPKFTAPDNYKDEEKIANYIKKKEATWWDKILLRSTTARVCAIGYAVDNDEPIIRISDNESYLLKGIIGMINKYSKVYTFNGNAFDLPMIERRALANNIQCHLPRAVSGYYDAKFVDIREKWNPRSSSLEDTVSLDGIAKLLGLPTKPGDGKDFYKWDKEKQDEYLAHDVNTLREISKRMGLHTAPSELGTMEVASFFPQQNEKEDIEI